LQCVYVGSDACATRYGGVIVSDVTCRPFLSSSSAKALEGVGQSVSLRWCVPVLHTQQAEHLSCNFCQSPLDSSSAFAVFTMLRDQTAVQ
jgi:hypothetical protein